MKKKVASQRAGLARLALCEALLENQSKQMQNYIASHRAGLARPALCEAPWTTTNKNIFAEQKQV